MTCTIYLCSHLGTDIASDRAHISMTHISLCCIQQYVVVDQNLLRERKIVKVELQPFEGYNLGLVSSNQQIYYRLC